MKKILIGVFDLIKLTDEEGVFIFSKVSALLYLAYYFIGPAFYFFFIKSQLRKKIIGEPFGSKAFQRFSEKEDEEGTTRAKKLLDRLLTEKEEEAK